ncbi:hypothetical protein BC831DRAFT_484369 [Entophlyctis helioformis]|nr:hypothetical protein BC831DRAFT_484369 [Entophlyctis helioformis]
MLRSHAPLVVASASPAHPTAQHFGDGHLGDHFGDDDDSGHHHLCKRAGSSMSLAHHLDKLPYELFELICQWAGAYTCWRNHVRPYRHHSLTSAQIHSIWLDYLSLSGPMPTSGNGGNGGGDGARVELPQLPRLDVELTLRELVGVVRNSGDADRLRRLLTKTRPSCAEERASASTSPSPPTVVPLLAPKAIRPQQQQQQQPLTAPSPSMTASRLRFDALFLELHGADYSTTADASGLPVRNTVSGRDSERVAPICLWMGRDPATMVAEAAGSANGLATAARDVLVTGRKSPPPLTVAGLVVLALRGHVELMRSMVHGTGTGTGVAGNGSGLAAAGMGSVRPDTAMVLHRGVLPHFFRDGLLGEGGRILECLEWLDKRGSTSQHHQPSLLTPRFLSLLLINILASSNFACGVAGGGLDGMDWSTASNSINSNSNSWNTAGVLSDPIMDSVLMFLLVRMPLAEYVFAACRWGRLEALRLCEGDLTPDRITSDVFQVAAEYGHTHILAYLNGVLIASESAVLHGVGQPQVTDGSGSERMDAMTLNSLIANPQLGVVRLVPPSKQSDDPLQRSIAAYARLGIFSRVCDLVPVRVSTPCTEPDTDTPVYAAAYGRLDVLHLLAGHTSHYTLTPQTIHAAAQFAHTAVLNFLLSRHVVPPPSALDAAATAGHLHVLHRLQSHAPHLSPSPAAFTGAAQRGHAAVVRHLLATYPAVCPPPQAVDDAAERGHLAVVQSILAAHPGLCTYRATLGARASGYLQIVDLLRDQP